MADKQTQIPEIPESGKKGGPGGTGGPGGSEQCNLLGEDIVKKTFPFTPLISLVICLAIFIYVLLSSESVADAKSIMSPEPIIILLMIGYSIILFNSFFNQQGSTAGKYYDRVIHQSPNKLVKTLVTIESLLTTPIQKIQCTVLNRWVEYFNYPFNYMIFTGALIVGVVMFMGYVQTALFKFGPDDLSPGNVDANGNRCSDKMNRVKYYIAVDANNRSSAMFPTVKMWSNLIQSMAIVGIIFTFATNYLVRKAIDSDDNTVYIDPFDNKKSIRIGAGANIKNATPAQKKGRRRMYWILRIIIWGLGIAGALTVGYNIRDYYTHIYENIFA